jgi:hypothetical protein
MTLPIGAAASHGGVSVLVSLDDESLIDAECNESLEAGHLWPLFRLEPFAGNNPHLGAGRFE